MSDLTDRMIEAGMCAPRSWVHRGNVRHILAAAFRVLDDEGYALQREIRDQYPEGDQVEFIDLERIADEIGESS